MKGNDSFDGLSRRRLFEAAAVAASLGAGAAGAHVGRSVGGEPAAAARQQEGEIDPVFGFPAESENVDPPEEADHTVQLRMRQPENGDDPQVPQMFFEPTGVAIEPGDTVMFEAWSPWHTVTAYHENHARQQRVPDGGEPFSSPVIPVTGYWLYRFEEEGVYDVYCASHEMLGMVMRAVVGDPGEREVGEASQRRLPPLGLGNLVLQSDDLRPEAIAEEESVSWNDARPTRAEVEAEMRRLFRRAMQGGNDMWEEREDERDGT